MFRSIMTAIANAFRSFGRQFKSGIWEPLEYTWGAAAHVWEDVAPVVRAPFRAAAKVGEFAAAAVALPFAAVGTGLASGQQSSSAPAVSASARRVGELEQAAADREARRVAREAAQPVPAWKLAIRAAKAVLAGTTLDMTETQHLSIEQRAWLAMLDRPQAIAVRNADPMALYRFFAGTGEVSGLRRLTAEELAEFQAGYERGASLAPKREIQTPETDDKDTVSLKI